MVHRICRLATEEHPRFAWKQFAFDFFFYRYFDQDSVLDRVPRMFLVLGGCYAAIQLVGVILLKDPPESISEQVNRNDEETQLLSSIGSVHNTDYSPRQVLKKKSFYMLWFLFLFNGQGIQFISSLYKTYGQTFIKDDHFLAIVGSLAAVCNGGGRILWGYLADKFCFKASFISHSINLISCCDLSFKELISICQKN
ncbi:uncharacterized protein LOC110457592 [Mizuhopecten yessoensis]|uniref:uncharacterized protein LOC110457592 n=1 Tax=Mizuhopecten yessoensis TaxID=6573 RepID=UPI000B459BC3|nr:uncharacterized protein LOC110457592 [Mizuhopecten yessoensis]